MRPSRLAMWLVGACAAAVALRCLARTEPPDVLIVVMDTARADRCSFLGYGRPTTPRLDELARESVVFEDAWSPSPWTFPAHAALFTGRRPESLGIVSVECGVLPRGTPTLAELLAGAGWATGCFTCNLWIAPHSGLTRGFRHVESFPPGSPRANAREAHAGALAWMRTQRKAGRRFLAFVNDVEPHTPWRPPEDVARRFVSDSLPAHAVAEAASLTPPRTTRLSLGVEPLSPDVLAAASDLYDGEIAALDAEVGALLDGMRAAGLLDRTLVVIAGDHGEGLGDHGWLEHMVVLHREVLRVPLIVRRPRGGGAERVASPVELHDVFPTVLEACGLPVPAGTESRSLLTDATPRAPRAAEDANYSFLLEHRGAASPGRIEALARRRRSIYDGRHHLIVDDRGAVELYEVAVDPAEVRNLAAERPATVTELGARLDPPRR